MDDDTTPRYTGATQCYAYLVLANTLNPQKSINDFRFLWIYYRNLDSLHCASNTLANSFTSIYSVLSFYIGV